MNLRAIMKLAVEINVLYDDTNLGPDWDASTTMFSHINQLRTRTINAYDAWDNNKTNETYSALRTELDTPMNYD